MNTKYIVTNKETEEIHEVKGFIFGNAQEQTTTVMTDIGNIVFANPNQSGELTNDRYTIKEI